jgi:ATP-dependent RNA helicase DHX8/PRP22
MNVAKRSIDNVIDHHQIYKKKQQQPKYMRESVAPYTTIRGGLPVHIHPSSVLFNVQGVHGRELPECVVYAELLITSKHYMRTVTKIESSWLTELLPQFFKKC